MTSSTIRELLKLAENPEIISFGGGNAGSWKYLQLGKIGEACRLRWSLKNLSNIALQYGATEGYQPLREMIVRLFQKEWVLVFQTENVMITSGSEPWYWLAKYSSITVIVFLLNRQLTWVHFKPQRRPLLAQNMSWLIRWKKE